MYGTVVATLGMGLVLAAAGWQAVDMELSDEPPANYEPSAPELSDDPPAISNDPPEAYEPSDPEIFDETLSDEF